MDHTSHTRPDSSVPGEHVFDETVLRPDTQPIPEQTDDGKPKKLQTGDKTIEHIVNDILHCYKNKLPLSETFFYKTVLGGHVDTVKQVVQSMEENDHTIALSWLLGTSEKSGRQSIILTPIEAPYKLRLARIGFITLSFILCTILSPVFYILHGVSSLLCKVIGSSGCTELPLTFAAFSHSSEMVQFFFSKNVCLKSTDSKGNNVFHQIASLSKESSRSACTAFATIVNNPQTNFKLLYPLMYEQRNVKGLTALEYVAQFGSPSLLTQMMNSEPQFRQIRFSVMDQGVMIKPPLYAQSAASSKSSSSSRDPEDQIDPRDRQTLAAAGATRVDLIDVTMYENDKVAWRSLLLRLVAERNVSSFSVKDFSLFHKCPVIGKWIQLKVKEMKTHIISVYVWDIYISCLFLFVLYLTHENTNLYLELSKKAMHVELGEYEARALGTSNILTPSALRTVTETHVLNLQLQWISDNVQFNESLKVFIRSELHINLTESDIWNLNTTSQQSVADLVLHQLDTGYALVVQNLSQVIISAMKKLKQKYPDLAQREISTNSIHKFENMLHKFFEEVEVSAANTSVMLRDIMSLEAFRKMACPSASNLPREAFKNQTQLHPTYFFPNINNICGWHSLQVMAQESCKHDTPKQVYDRFNEILSIRAHSEAEIATALLCLLSSAVIYVVIDTLEHYYFFMMVIISNKSIWEMFRSACSTRVPGSYYRKQLSIITYYVVIFHWCTRYYMEWFHSSMSSESNILVAKITDYLLLFGLILRFIMHIHSMRLIPWIGHFISTTFMMANKLIHFSTVLGLVILIFSLIFHLLIVNEDCPVNKYDGYETLEQSMLSVFMLAFGHGDFDQYQASAPVTVAYAFFVVIVALLLLNLIIAIMNATARDLMTEEGKATLQKTEWLNEALSVEFTFTTLLMSIKRNLNLKYKAGYHVVKYEDKAKVFLRVFYCDKLRLKN